MTYLGILAVLSGAFQMFLSGFVVFAILRFGAVMNVVERLGLALIGGAGFLTLAPVAAMSQHATPYDGWAGLLLRLGCILFAVARTWRSYRHEVNNGAARRDAAAYLKGRR